MNVSRKMVIGLMLALVGIGYGAYQFSTLSATSVPQSFTDARTQGAMLAQQIVTASDGIVLSLNKISALEEADPESALSILTEVTEQTTDIRERADELSREIEKMARALPGIESEAAREAAIRAINHRLELISHLITYSNLVNELLDTLRADIRGEAVPQDAFATYITQINERVDTINELNEQAAEAMLQFDELTK